jgi:hypothetical protein
MAKLYRIGIWFKVCTSRIIMANTVRKIPVVRVYMASTGPRCWSRHGWVAIAEQTSGTAADR